MRTTKYAPRVQTLVIRFYRINQLGKLSSPVLFLGYFGPHTNDVRFAMQAWRRAHKQCFQVILFLKNPTVTTLFVATFWLITWQSRRFLD